MTYEQVVDWVFQLLTLGLRIRGDVPTTTQPYLDYPAEQSRFSKESYEYLGLALELEPKVLVGIALITAPGELETHVPLMTAIIESMRYTAPPSPIEKGAVVWQYQTTTDELGLPIEFFFFGPVAVAPNGNVHVRGYERIYVWDATGVYLHDLDLGWQAFPPDIAVSPDGTVWYAVESGDGDIPGWVGHLAAGGGHIGRFDLGLADDETFIDRPQFIVVDREGMAYAAFLIEGDEAEPDVTRIRVLTPDREALAREFDLEGVVEPIQDLKMGPDNLLYVLVGGKVRIHDLEGRLVEERSFVLPTSARRIAIAPDGKWYIAVTGGAVLCYDRDGNYLYQFGRPIPPRENNDPYPLEEGQIGGVQDMAMAPNGDLVVTDYGYGYGRVMQITFSGD